MPKWLQYSEWIGIHSDHLNDYNSVWFSPPSYLSSLPVSLYLGNYIHWNFWYNLHKCRNFFFLRHVNIETLIPLCQEKIFGIFQHELDSCLESKYFDVFLCDCVSEQGQPVTGNSKSQVFYVHWYKSLLKVGTYHINY